MAGSGGWAVITYRELTHALEQRTSFILKTCSRSPDSVVGVRICKVTGIRSCSLREGIFIVVFVESPFQLENGLLGTVVKMLMDILNFLQVFQVLWKKMLGFFLLISEQKLYIKTEILFPFILGFFWKKGR